MAVKNKKTRSSNEKNGKHHPKNVLVRINREQNDKKKDVHSFKFNIIYGLNGLLNLRSTYIDDSRFLSIFNSSLEKVKILKKYYVEENEIQKFTELEKQIFIKNDNITKNDNEKYTRNNNEKYTKNDNEKYTRNKN